MKITRILLTLIAALLVIALSAVIVACTPHETPHTHTFSKDWTWDDNDHWHVATCGHESEVSGKTSHELNAEGQCTVCGFTAPRHTVKFVAESGLVEEIAFFEGQTKVAEPNVPEKTGYVGDWENYTLGDSDITVNAVYKAIEYGITFNYNKSVGSWEDNAPTSYTIEGLQLPRLLSDDNTHVAEWQATDGTIYTDSIPQGTTGKLELTAVWKLTETGKHTWDVNCQCRVCGQMKEPCSIVEGEVKPYTLNDNKITFGMYPQTEVKDNALKFILNAERGNKIPSSGNANGWTDYGYYVEGKVQSYMWYIDVEYQSVKYRGVYFTNYRPICTTYASSGSSGRQDDHGYRTNTCYWFKYEPITWRILSQTDGEAFLWADLIVDAQQYYHDENSRQVNATTYFANSYKESDIRYWLNDHFYNTAFDEFSRQFIVQTEVNNSASTTVSPDNFYARGSNTNDYVFLLSYADLTNTSYGFADSDGEFDDSRMLKISAYALCQGASVVEESDYVSWNNWWTRSPSDESSYRTSFVSYFGAIYSYPVETVCGVAPALHLVL